MKVEKDELRITLSADDVILLANDGEVRRDGVIVEIQSGVQDRILMEMVQATQS